MSLPGGKFSMHDEKQLFSLDWKIMWLYGGVGVTCPIAEALLSVVIILY